MVQPAVENDMSQSRPTDAQANTYAENYVLYGDQSRAFRVAFPDSKAKAETVHVRASIFHQISTVQVRVAELAAQVAKEAADTFKIDAAYVMQRIAGIDRMDVADIIAADGSVLPVDQWPIIWRQYITSFEIAEIAGGSSDKRVVIGILKKIKWPDKIKNLEMMGRLAAVGAFKDIVEINGKITMTIANDEDGL